MIVFVSILWFRYWLLFITVYFEINSSRPAICQQLISWPETVLASWPVNFRVDLYTMKLNEVQLWWDFTWGDTSFNMNVLAEKSFIQWTQLGTCLYSLCINSLVPGRFQFNFRWVILKLTLVNGGWGILWNRPLRWMPLDLADDKSTLVQVMAWCRQATSHYLSQCWPRPMLPYGIYRP